MGYGDPVQLLVSSAAGDPMEGIRLDGHVCINKLGKPLLVSWPEMLLVGRSSLIDTLLLKFSHSNVPPRSGNLLLILF